MKRRGFMGLLGAAVAAPVVAQSYRPSPAPDTYDVIVRVGVWKDPAGLMWEEYNMERRFYLIAYPHESILGADILYSKGKVRTVKDIAKIFGIEYKGLVERGEESMRGYYITCTSLPWASSRVY